ncbi:protein transport protein SEC24 [Nematocida sp. AWRm77]|nr:protein transport protein SEC24 [Nematocida sp. AWRm77]
MHYSTHSLGGHTAENEEMIGQVKAIEYVYTRSTFTSAPGKKADLKKTEIPFIITAAILPAEEEEVAQVSSAPRCTQCKAYLNPYCEVVPPGYKWRCALCKALNDVATPLHSYGAYLRVFSPNENADNNRKVCTNPVLTQDVIEFPSNMDSNTPHPFVYLFAVECTEDAIEKGSFACILSNLHRAVASIHDPYDRSEMAILLFGSSVQVVRLRSYIEACGTEPEQTEDVPLYIDTVNEVNSSLPMLMDSEYVVRIKTLRHVLEPCLKKVMQSVLSSQREAQSNFGLALRVAKHLLYAEGQMYAFVSTMPSLGAGALNTGPDTSTGQRFYESMGEELLAKSICVNVFVMASKIVEMTQMLPIVEKTGGDVRYYPAFMDSYAPDQAMVVKDLMQHLSSETGGNAYCRVRVSDGASITKYWGASVRPDGVIKLSALRRGKAFSFEVEYDEDLVMEGLSVQIAAIFNTAGGKRTVRVINFTVGLGPTSVDPLGVLHAIALKAVDRELAEKGAGLALAVKMATSAVAFTGVQGTMGVFPRLVYALLKNKVFKSVSSDLRGVIIHGIRNQAMKIVDALIYPTLVRIDGGVDAETEEIVLPSPLKLSSSVISTDGTYLLDSGIIAYVFTGDSSKYRVLDGVEGRATIPLTKEYGPIHNVLKYMMGGRGVDPVVYSVHQSGHSFLLEGFQGMLVEDGGSSLSSSYQEFVHRFLSKGYASK